MIILAIAIAIWTPIVMAPWLVVGPWRLAGKLQSKLWA
jgi:hypothetical protein